jgi:predicted GNAT family acetyltransferase
MPDIEITCEDGETKGRYVGRVPGHDEAAELTYSRAGSGLLVADHTFVPDSLRGTGAGRALAERLVADARAGGYRIHPLCPFVRAQFEKHPDWAGILHG